MEKRVIYNYNKNKMYDYFSTITLIAIVLDQNVRNCNVLGGGGGGGGRASTSINNQIRDHNIKLGTHKYKIFL